MPEADGLENEEGLQKTTQQMPAVIMAKKFALRIWQSKQLETIITKIRPGARTRNADKSMMD